MAITAKVPFNGTKEQETRLLALIDEHREQKGALMPVLQGAQGIYGYMPVEVQRIISKEMGIPLSEVYGTVTFYSQFSLSPKGRFKIGICLGTACYVRGSGKILEKFEEKLGIKVGECTEDGKYSLDATRCIGACGLAPVLTVNEDVYGKLVEADVEKILAKYADK